MEKTYNGIKTEPNNTTEQNTTIEEVSVNQWLEEEEKNISSGMPQQYEKLPSAKFEENKIVELEIDFSKPFGKYNAEMKGKNITKAIIPVTQNGERRIWWLNVKNPVYQNVVHSGRDGKTKFKVLQTGNVQNTKYILVE